MWIDTNTSLFTWDLWQVSEFSTISINNFWKCIFGVETKFINPVSLSDIRQALILVMWTYRKMVQIDIGQYVAFIFNAMIPSCCYLWFNRGIKASIIDCYSFWLSFERGIISCCLTLVRAILSAWVVLTTHYTSDTGVIIGGWIVWNLHLIWQVALEVHRSWFRHNNW